MEVKGGWTEKSDLPEFNMRVSILIWYYLIKLYHGRKQNFISNKQIFALFYQSIGTHGFKFTIWNSYIWVPLMLIIIQKIQASLIAISKPAMRKIIK